MTVQETFSVMRTIVSNNKSISVQRKKELNQFIDDLKTELESIEKENADQALSIASFSKIVLHENLRNTPKEAQKDSAVQGLTHAIEEFETSHPTLMRSVQQLMFLMSEIGI